VPTEHSWTELRRGAADLRALLAFRAGGLSDRALRRLRWAGAALLLLTLVAAFAPAIARRELNGNSVSGLVAIMPTLYLGFLVLAILAAVSSGGGREIVPREQAVAFPISTVTEHLGAMLLAPLNIAWLIQAWALLGSTSYVVGTHNLVASLLPVLLWILFATTAGQLVGWLFEGIRRGPYGVWLTRAITAAFGAGIAVLVLTDTMTRVLDRSPTVKLYLIVLQGAGGQWAGWAFGVAVLIALIAVTALAGLVPARWALHRPLREELRLESGIHEARPRPRSDLAAMIRLDRASVWRSVPLRRGLFVLGLMPGGVALAGDLTWDLVTVLPGLVASGGALLFGVNAWCLDGRGALWRDSLPAEPGVAFASKAIVLTEVLLVPASLTLLLASFRAGPPTSAEIASVLAATLVVCLQVVAASMRWSVRRPFASELRSARATPAPPVVMVGYSARLALATTMVGLLFSATSQAADWRPAVLLAVPLLCWSGYRLAATASAWTEPQVRARVVAVVAT
jgi:hypothetical protein